MLANQMMKKGIWTLALSLLAAGAVYGDDISLGIPGYGGNGCPAGTVDAVLSPDAKTLSVMFDQFVAKAGRSEGKSMDRKSCNLAIPVHVPQGFSVSVVQLDYRGFVSVPYGGQARFNVEYFFAGSRGPILSKAFGGGSNEDYLVTDELNLFANVWSRCGADTNLRVNSSMIAISNRQGDDVLGSVDSTDITAGLVYHLAWRRCN